EELIQDGRGRRACKHHAPVDHEVEPTLLLWSEVHHLVRGTSFGSVTLSEALEQTRDVPMDRDVVRVERERVRQPPETHRVDQCLIRWMASATPATSASVIPTHKGSVSACSEAN